MKPSAGRARAKALRQLGVEARIGKAKPLVVYATARHHGITALLHKDTQEPLHMVSYVCSSMCTRYRVPRKQV